MPKKVFTGGYTYTYPEIMTPDGTLVAVPGTVYDLGAYPDDGRWADAPGDPGPGQAAPAPVRSQPAAPGPSEAVSPVTDADGKKVS
jgi:hypothetical protein